jgi:hypothetical protein
MLAHTLLWGLAAGAVHFALIGILYGNPLIDGIYREAGERSPAMKKWSSRGRYLVTQFLGTQVEVFILAFAFLWLRASVGVAGWTGALLLGVLLAAIRVYPRFWNMWIQSAYPNKLLAIEAVNGTLGTLAIVLFLQAVV